MGRVLDKITDENFRLKFHAAALIIVFIAAFPICLIPALNTSLPLLVFISVLALVLSELVAVETVYTYIKQRDQKNDCKCGKS